MEIMWAIIVLVIIIGGVLIHGAKEFGLSKEECANVAVDGIVLFVI